jgi:hypothetical protein
MRNEKVIAPESKGDQGLTKTNHRTSPKLVHKHEKTSFYIALLLLVCKDDFKEKKCSYNTLNCLK